MALGVIANKKGAPIGSWFEKYRKVSFFSEDKAFQDTLVGFATYGVPSSEAVLEYSQATLADIFSALASAGYTGFPNIKETPLGDVLSKNLIFSWMHPRYYMMQSDTHKLVAMVFIHSSGIFPIFISDSNLNTLLATVLKDGIEKVSFISTSSEISKSKLERIPSDEATIDDFTNYFSLKGYELVPPAVAEEKAE